MIGLGMKGMTRADAIMARFGVSARSVERNHWREAVEGIAREVMPVCTPGCIVLITGASGSGKSLLMRALGQHLGLRAAECQGGEIAGRLVCDCMPWLELEEALEVLARFGLGEVYTYLSPAECLSAGQQSRLRLAMAYARASAGHARVLLSDEFATQLDRFSAAVIARNLRRAIDSQRRMAAVVATCHDDLEKALRPDITVSCDFGEYHLGRRNAGGIGL